MNTSHKHHLSTPLISSSPNSKYHNYSNTLHGLLLLIFVAILSIWAAKESSKDFDVTVLKASEFHNSLAAKRFNLMYVANGKAGRILIRADHFIKNQLKSNAKQNLHSVTLRLSDRSIPSAVEVVKSSNENEFVLILNPDLLLQKQTNGNLDADVTEALLRGMIRVNMWNFHSQTGDDNVSVAVMKEMEESVILEAGKLHLTDFHRLIG